MISIQNVNLSIGNKQILSDITVDIPDDRKTVIIGKSGCGKTMLMKTLEGLYVPQSGRIIIDGVEITGTAAKKRGEVFDKLAMLFQYAALLDSFTVYQNIALPLVERKKLTPSEIREIVNEILQFVKLEYTAELFPAELSGGMRKRIGLARALVTNPRYLILDEPTTGLDPLTTEEVMIFLQLVIGSKNVVPITITHDPYCIDKLGDYIIMVDDSRVIFSGDKAELQKDHDTLVHKFYKSFFL
jgi:phospholipid/cholesterol/gamma-HCH transport system ATP-binding protein